MATVMELHSMSRDARCMRMYVSILSQVKRMLHKSVPEGACIVLAVPQESNSAVVQMNAADKAEAHH